MRALRIFALVSLLVVGGFGSAMAQRITAPGDYEVNVCIAPGFLPGGVSSLPVELQGVNEQSYAGTLSVKQNANGTYSLDFKGERLDGATLTVSAEFESDWGGEWSHPDYPHFQYGYCRPSPTQRARDLYAAGGLEAVWREVGAM